MEDVPGCFIKPKENRTSESYPRYPGLDSCKQLEKSFLLEDPLETVPSSFVRNSVG